MTTHKKIFFSFRFIGFLILALCFSNSFGQKIKRNPIDTSAFAEIPFFDGSITYEGIFSADDSISSQKLFNAVKRVFLNNTNYKYTKIDEDRMLGNITAEFTYTFSASPGIMELIYMANSFISVDIKENKYRLRIYRNKASTKALNVSFDFTMEEIYLGELARIKDKKKWNQERSVVLNWHTVIFKIFNSIPRKINLELVEF
jgi:hypothetical protein